MLNVAIVAGGDSGEYRISMNSGRQVELNMDHGLFNPFLIRVRGKDWSYRIGMRRFPVDKNDFSIRLGRRKIKFDVVFNAIHGTPGENGILQGYFDMMHIPCTSSGVTTAALTFNKSYCKDVVAACGITIARSMHLFREQFPDPDDILKKLALPFFVKPNNGGSSVGMSKVNHRDGLEPAIVKAFQEDREILIEEYISGRELTCGVLRSEGKIVALPVTEIIPKNEYFDFEAKYKKGMSDEVVPAMIPAKVSDLCREISARLYLELDCRGVVRFDYIWNGVDFHFLEVNTVPGLSAASIVPKMAHAHGWSFTELITRLIREAIPNT